MTTKLRVNKTSNLAWLPSPLGDKNPKGYIAGTYTPIPKGDDVAKPLNKAEFTPRGSYRTGDGEVPCASRPGADQHKQYKSLIT
jgi:hypothetical protein